MRPTCVIYPHGDLTTWISYPNVIFTTIEIDNMYFLSPWKLFSLDDYPHVNYPHELLSTGKLSQLNYFPHENDPNEIIIPIASELCTQSETLKPPLELGCSNLDHKPL